MNSFSESIARLRELGLQGQGIRVGHLDTGIDGAHPAFAGRIAAFRRFGYRGIAEEAIPACDSGRHGTHTAGLIVGQEADNHTFGIAPSARLFAGMVIEEGNIISRVLAGLDWLIDCEVQVVCLTLGVFTDTPVFRSLIREMTRRDILIVCPIGNRGAGKASTPGCYPEVLAVGAANIDDSVPAFSGSCHQPNSEVCEKPDLLAPGVVVLSAIPGGAFGELSGTSMAAAQVAGCAALLKGAFPNLPNLLIKTALIKSCNPLPTDQNHRAANGMINPIKAYELLNSREKDSLTTENKAVDNSEKATFKKFVDPRLVMQLNMTTETSLCEAVFEFESKDAVSDFIRFIASANSCDDSYRSSFKVLKHGPIVICQAPQVIIKQVMQWSSVSIASACDFDRFL